MYILIQLEPLHVITFETKTDLSNYIGVHRNTITNRFELHESWECSKGKVYQANKHYSKVKRGNKDDMQTKIGKRNGEIPCKNSKLDKG